MVWANSAFLLVLNRMPARRAWNGSKFEQEEISLYPFCPGSQTSISYVFAELAPISPVHSTTVRKGKPSRRRISSASAVSFSSSSRSEEHTSELQSLRRLVGRLLLE